MIFEKWIIIFFISFLLNASSHGQEGRWEEPWLDQTRRVAKEESTGEKLSPAQRVAEVLFQFFQTNISPLDGERCPSYPPCSQYAREAVRKHGAVLGLVMTFDRLIHESDEVRSAPLIPVGGSRRYYDPVENNDFWWYKK